MDERPDPPEYRDCPDLSGLGAVTPLPATSLASADTLERIVARSRRGRARAAVATVAVAALAGSAAGYVVATNTTNASTRVATAASQPPGPTPGQAGVIATGDLTSPATRVFLRTTTDGIRLRAYEPPAVPPPKACAPNVQLVGEISDDVSAGSLASVSFAAVAEPNRATPALVDASAVLGQAEGSPMWTLIVRSGASVAKVVAHFPDGSTDEMAPVRGWAILAHHVATGQAKPDVTASTVASFSPTGVALGTLAPQAQAPAVCVDVRHLGDEMKPVTTTIP